MLASRTELTIGIPLQMTTQPLAQRRAARVPATFRALRHRNYRLWFFGQGVSQIGTWMQTMAQQVLVYRLTGSAAALGIANFMMVVPLVPLALWGGSLSDRLPKRTIVVATQTFMLLQALVLAWLTWSGVVEVWHVYVMSFLLGAIKAVDMPARHAFVVDMVEGKEDLTNAIGLNSAIYNGARTLGPALAGVAVAALGEAIAFLLNALSFLAVIGSLLWMRDLPQSSKSATERHVVAHTVEGIRFAFRHETLLVLLSLVAVSCFLSMPYTTLMPVFANEVLQESAQPLVHAFCSGEFLSIHCQAPEALPLGLLLTAVGVGAVTGALLVASLPDRARRGWVLTFGNLAFPLCLLVFAVSRSMALSLALMLLVGITYVMQNAVANTLLQIHAPDDLRGRVMSLYALVNEGTRHVGGLQAGFVADWMGAPLSVGLGAAVSLAYGFFIALRYQRVRELA